MHFERYNCLVVDDEPIARKIILNYIQQSPSLRVAGECINALDAIEHLRSDIKTDIIFLDINMPGLSGLQFVRILKPQQAVIFTTAYTEYAVESYELNATDYLLKPFSFERFTKAVNKAVGMISHSSADANGMINPQRIIFIKSDGKNYPVSLDDILYCEAMKNYTKVILKGEHKLMPLIPLSRFQMMLAEAGGEFIQVHRSFLIAAKHIASLSPACVMIGKFEIPIGVQFKENFLRYIGIKKF